MAERRPGCRLLIGLSEAQCDTFWTLKYAQSRCWQYDISQQASEVDCLGVGEMGTATLNSASRSPPRFFSKRTSTLDGGILADCSFVCVSHERDRQGMQNREQRTC